MVENISFEYGIQSGVDMNMKLRAVRVVSKKDGKGYTTYTVTIPKEIVNELGINPGDIFFVRIVDVEIDGVKKRAIVYYKP